MLIAKAKSLLDTFMVFLDEASISISLDSIPVWSSFKENNKISMKKKRKEENFNYNKNVSYSIIIMLNIEHKSKLIWNK